MEYENLGTPIKEVIEEFKTYVEDVVTYNKLVFVRGASELSSLLILMVVIFGISGFVLLFFSFAFAGWFVDITGLGIGTGHLVVAVFYMIMGVLVFVYRKRLIFNPSRKLFGEIFFADNDLNEEGLKFDTEEDQADNINKVRERITKEKESLNQKVKSLEENLTFSRIFQELLGKAYSSIVTTSNIAKFAFSLIKTLKGLSSSKKRRAKKDKLIEKKKKTD